MVTEDTKPESTLVTKQETEDKEVHSDASGLLQADKLSREEKKREESLPENPLMDDKEEHAEVSNATAVTKIDPEILHSGVDVLDETKTKASEYSETASIEGDSISSNKYDDFEEEKSTEIIKPADYAHVNLPLEQASLEEESPSESPIQERGIVKDVEEDLNGAHNTTEESTTHEEEISVQRTDDQNKIAEQVEEDKPNQDLTSGTDEAYKDSGINQNIKEESINLEPEDISPSNLTAEEHHGNAEESTKPASTEKDDSLGEVQSDAQADEADEIPKSVVPETVKDDRKLLEVSIPTASEETKESKEDLAYITDVVPQVSEEKIEKENDTIDKDVVQRKPVEEEACVDKDLRHLDASDISSHEEPQKAIKSEDIDYESILGLASNDQTTKQEQEDKESIIETAEKCESEAENVLQDHGKDTVLQDHGKVALDPDCRSTEAVSETNVAGASSAEALEEMASVKLPNQETTQITSEGADAEGNIVCEATDASFATSLKEQLLQNEGYEPAESNISDSQRKSEKIEEPEDAEITDGEHLADEQNQQATEPLSIEDQNGKSQEDIPTSQDLSEESEIYTEKHKTEEKDQIEDAEYSSRGVPELESSLETYQKEEQKQEAAPNADVLQTSNQPETTEDTQRLSTEVEIQDKDVNIEEAVKSSSVEENYIPDDSMVSHEDSEIKVDDTSDEMDNVSQTTKLEVTEQVEPNQDLTSSTNEKDDSLEEFQSDAQTDEADEIPKSVVPETEQDDRELLEVSIQTASEETKEDLADITNVVPQVSEENGLEKEKDIIDGDDALLRKPGKEDISQYEEPQNAVEKEDIDCEKSIPGPASNDQTTKQEQGETKSEAEIELQDHGKDVLSDSAVQTVEHHNVDHPLDDPLEGKSEKIEESSIEKETGNAEITGGAHLADEQNQQETTPLSVEDQDYKSKQDIPRHSEPETTEDTQKLNAEVEIQDKHVNIEEAGKSGSVEEKYIRDDALVSHVDSELKSDDVSDVITDNVSQATKLEDILPAEEGKVDDHDRNSTKEEEYPGALQDEMPETQSVDEEPNPGSTAEETIAQTPPEEIKEEKDNGLNTGLSTGVTKDEIFETINSESPDVTAREISEIEPIINPNENTQIAGEESMVEVPPHSTSGESTNQALPEIENGESNAQVTRSKVESNVEGNSNIGTASVITKLEENQTSLEDQIEEEPFQVVTAEKTMNPTSAEVEVEGYASNSTKEDDLTSEAFTGETKEETIEEHRQVLTSEEIDATEDAISITDTAAIDELNQKVSEPETTYDTESFRREMQGGENVVEELPQLSNTEEIVYQPVERKEERTVNDEHHQEGVVNEISSAHNNSIENIKLEEGMTTEAAWIQTVEVPFQDSDKDYIEDAAIINESTVEKNSDVHLINDTAEIPSLESEATKLEEHNLVDVTRSVGEKDMPAEEVIVDKEESIAKVVEMNSESKSEDTRSNVDEMSENIISTDENTKIDSSSTKIEEKDDLAVLQDPAVVHAPFESSTPESDVDNMEKEDPETETDAKIVDQEEEMTIIHPKDGDESLQPEVEPEGEAITEEVSIIKQDDSSKEYKSEENFQEQGNMSTQTSATKPDEEEKDQDQNEYQPALTTGHDSAREAQSEPLLLGKSQETSEETIEEPRQISTSEETGDYSPAKEELNQKVLEPKTIDDTESSTRQMQGEENVVEELPQLSNTEETVHHAVETKEETILDSEFHQENTVNEISSVNNNLAENIKLEEGITTEIAHEERTVEVPSHDSSSNKTSNQELSDLPAEDIPIVEKAIIYNPEVKDNEESIAKVDEINSETKSEDTTIEVESEPNLITNEGLSDSNMEIEEKGVPEPQTDAIISGDNQVPSESLLVESSSDIIKEMEREDASKEYDDKDEKVEEPVRLSSHEIQNEPYFLSKIPTERTDQIDSSSTKIEEEDDLEVLQDLAAVHEPFESTAPVSDVDNMEKEDPKTGTDAKIVDQEEEMTVIYQKDGDETLQPEGEVVSKEASIIMQDSSSKEQEIEEKFQVIENNNSPIDVSESEAVPLPFKISDADQDMEITATEDPKTGIDTNTASEDKIMPILEKSQAGETLQTDTENVKPESTSNVEAHAVSSSTPEISFKDDEMGANDKESVLNEDKEEYIPKNTSASKVENEQSLNNRPTEELLTEGKVPDMLPEIQHGEEAEESMTSLEDLLQTSRDVNIKAAENEGDKPYSDEDKAEEDTKEEAASDSPVLVEASRDADVKVTPKKSNNILSGVGSKVKNSIAKVKKVITGKSSSPKPSSPTS